LRHQEIQKCLYSLFNERTPIDIITIQNWLKDRKLLEQVGGIAYLLHLQDTALSAANLSAYLEILREKYLMRSMISICTEAAGRIYEHDGDVDSLMDEIERDVLAVAESRNQNETADKNTLINRAITTIERMWERKGVVSGLTTGYPDLDSLLDGLHHSEMIVIAARPSLGKTSLAMNIVEHVAIECRLPVAVFSLEMSGEALITRMMCSLARVNLRSIRDGFMAETDGPKLTHAAGKMNGAPFYIDDTAGLSIMQLRARARRLHQMHGIKLFVVDYLQLLHSTGKRRDENRQQEISDISGGLKALAKELKVPVIVLSQLNREVERDKTRTPRLSDLRESGAIEQDSDVVGLLYKPGVTKAEGGDEPVDNPESMPVNLLIAKQRNGPTDVVNFTFLKLFTRFESAAKVDDSDVPENRKPYAE
jgi:replicative DNA helicase